MKLFVVVIVNEVFMELLHREDVLWQFGKCGADLQVTLTLIISSTCFLKVNLHWRSMRQVDR